MAKEYRLLNEDEVIAEGDESGAWTDYGLAGGAYEWEPVPPWMLGKQAKSVSGIRRPVDTEKEELRAALKTCLHVIEKGIEVRMMGQWPVLQQILPDAVKKARSALRL